MAKTGYENKAIDTKPFADLVGEDVIVFVFEHAPKKVATRIASALDHFARSALLVGIDEAMGAIRLIAAEEELVVGIFEWLKLNQEHFPEHRDFARKFKNHVVKLSFYPVLLLFRIVCGNMIRDGFMLDGWEGLIDWTAKPVVDGQSIKLALFDDKGKELIRTNPLATALSQGDLSGEEVVPLLLVDLLS